MTDRTKKGVWPLCFFFLARCLSGCAACGPPFTRHLTQTMTLERVLQVAAEEGYGTSREVAQYKGYRLLCFARGEGGGGDEVFLVVNGQGRPMLRNVAYDRMDRETLVNFVEDLLRHNG
jgi:hypothetical protein